MNKKLTPCPQCNADASLRLGRASMNLVTGEVHFNLCPCGWYEGKKITPQKSIIDILNEGLKYEI